MDTRVRIEQIAGSRHDPEAPRMNPALRVQGVPAARAAHPPSCLQPLQSSLLANQPGSHAAQSQPDTATGSCRGRWPAHAVLRPPRLTHTDGAAAWLTSTPNIAHTCGCSYIRVPGVWHVMSRPYSECVTTLYSNSPSLPVMSSCTNDCQQFSFDALPFAG